jgi:hypothetical protein
VEKQSALFRAFEHLESTTSEPLRVMLSVCSGFNACGDRYGEGA